MEQLRKQPSVKRNGSLANKNGLTMKFRLFQTEGDPQKFFFLGLEGVNDLERLSDILSGHLGCEISKSVDGLAIDTNARYFEIDDLQFCVVSDGASGIFAYVIDSSSEENNYLLKQILEKTLPYLIKIVDKKN